MSATNKYDVTLTTAPTVVITVPSNELERLGDLGLINTMTAADVSADEPIITDGQVPQGVPDGTVWYNRAAV